MPGTPKPPGQRRRRNASQPRWHQLPAGGRKGRVPALPRKAKGTWLKSTREWWEQVWKSPMATAWVDADLHTVLRLAHMRDSLGRNPVQPSLQAQVTALEDRLGLTPKARRALQWEIAQSGAEKEEPVARVRHLRAVDGAAS